MIFKNNINMIKVLFIFCISTFGFQCLAEIDLNTSTTANNTIPFRPIETLIINGSPAALGEYPFQVYIKSDLNGCGGSIINNNTVLTAAHCVYDAKKHNKLIPAYKIKVYAGHVTKSLTQEFSVRKVIPHKKYDTKKFEYDIAILKISQHFWNGRPTKNIAPISVASQLFVDNTECTASGWGYTIGNGRPADNLMHTKVKIYNHKKCDEIYQKQTHTKISKSMICAVNLNISTVCKGDSGGPLIVNNTQTGNQPQLIGIVSFGMDGCSTNVPSVYTNVYSYKEWILKNNGISYKVIGLNQFLYSILLSGFILYFKLK